MNQPLAGVRVLDATTTLLGPYCTLILAQLGADGVRVLVQLRRDTGEGLQTVLEGDAWVRARTEDPPA